MPRKSDYRHPRETMLIVVEGETELIYFNQLKAEQRLSNLSIEPKISPRKDPLSIINRAELENERKNFDYTWCVFDLETKKYNTNQYQEAFKKAKEFDFYLAESLPCFEVWFLFHFTYTSKQFENCSYATSDLCKYIDDYCKTQKYLQKKNLYALLKDKMKTAIENCKKLELFNTTENITDGTRCDIYKLILSIEKLK